MGGKTVQSTLCNESPYYIRYIGLQTKAIASASRILLPSIRTIFVSPPTAIGEWGDLVLLIGERWLLPGGVGRPSFA